MSSPTTLVVRSATRAVWETSMDGVAVVLSAILRFSLFPRNNYADSDRICAQLEKTRLRRAGLAHGAHHVAGVASAHYPHHRSPHQLAPDDVFVIDARRADEFNHSHVYSAVNCHYSDVAEVEALFATHGVRKNQSIVVYCAVGLRSGWVARKLRKRGYVNAATLYGGYYHWGHPIYDGDKRAYEVMPQHRPAGMLIPANMKVKVKSKARQVREKSTT